MNWKSCTFVQKAIVRKITMEKLIEEGSFQKALGYTKHPEEIQEESLPQPSFYTANGAKVWSF